MIRKLYRLIKDFFENTLIYVDPNTGEKLDNKTEDSITIKNNGYERYKRFINNDNIRSHLYD